MLKLSHATLWLSAMAAFPLAAHAQQQQPQSPGQAPAPAPSVGGGSSETTTTTTSRPAAPPSPDLNTDTNSQPDITGSSGHPNSDVRMKGSGTLASAMANFSVRTGLEIRPSSTGQVVVQTVRPDSPAARAGIEAGDVVTNINGNEVTTIESLQKQLTKQPSQAAYFASFRRGEHSFRAPLGRQLSLMGMTLFPDPADRPVVKAVDSASPAERAGFKVGDVITGVDRQDTATMAKLLDFVVPFMRNLSQGQGIPFRVVRDGKPTHFSVTRPADSELPLLTPDQERHLRRVADGADDRPRRDQRSNGRKVTRTTRTKRNEMNSVNNQGAEQPNQNQNGLAGAGGFGGGVGLGLDGGGIGDSGIGGGTTGANGSSNGTNAAVAVIHGTAGSGQQSATSGQQGQQGGQQGQQGGQQGQQGGQLGQQAQQGQQAGMNGSNSQNSGMGVVGFVQIQSNVGLNGQNGTPSNINPSAPGANPETGNTTSDTGVNPVTGNAATNNLNPAASAANRPQRGQGQQAMPQQGSQTQNLGGGLQQTVTPTAGGFGDSLGNLNGSNTAGNPINGNNGTNGVNGTNGTNGANGDGTNTNNSQQPTQSFVSAQVSRLPAGTYTLSVGQFGGCGDSAGAAPGPSAFTLGTITVSAGGQGTLPQRTININPQAFVGRTVSLIAQNSQSAQSNSGVVGCGKFRMSGQGQGQGQNQGNGLIGNQNGGIGLGVGNNGVGGVAPGMTGANGTGRAGNGTATGTGTATGAGGTATGTGTAGKGGATGTGTANPGTAPGSLTPPGGLPKPEFP